jgi:Na+/H+ antiporter NhaA
MRPEIAPARWVYIPEKNGPGQRACVVCWSGARENPGVTEPGGPAARFSPRTVWTQNLQTPLRRFLRTETGSAAVLLAATLAALAWANIDPSGYAAAWHTELMIRSGTRGLADSWQGWVNSGLMAFFFLVAGLEARREFDMGELRERRRLALPLVVALGGIVVPISIYLAINAGGSSASG